MWGCSARDRAPGGGAQPWPRTMGRRATTTVAGDDGKGDKSKKNVIIISSEVSGAYERGHGGHRGGGYNFIVFAMVRNSSGTNFGEPSACSVCVLIIGRGCVVFVSPTGFRRSDQWIRLDFAGFRGLRNFYRP